MFHGLFQTSPRGLSLPPYAGPVVTAIGVVVLVSAAWQLSRRGLTLTGPAARAVLILDVGVAVAMIWLLAEHDPSVVLAVVPVLVEATFVAGAAGGLLAWAVLTVTSVVSELADHESIWVGGHLPRDVLASSVGLFVVGTISALTRHLTDENEAWSALVDAAAEAIFVVGPRGDIRLVNPRALQLFGYREDELLGASIELLVPDALLGRHARERDAWAHAPRPRSLTAHLDLRCRRKDGTEFPSEIMLSPVERRGETSTLAIAADITERKRAEEALREAEERYRNLVERIPAIVYLAEFGEPAPWLYVSPRTASILGYPAEDWIADEGLWMRSVHPDDLERVLECERRSKATHGPFECEYRMVAADGTIVWIRDEAEFVPGDPPLLSGIMYDVTRSRAAEADLAANLGALRRTDEQRRLLLSKIVSAQEAERARIAADLHDDTVQSMTAVGMRLAMLESHLTDEPLAREVLAKAEASVTKSIRALRSLLFDLHPRGLDQPGGLQTTLRDSLHRLAEETGVDISFVDRVSTEPSPDARTICYRTALEALSNVRKHATARNVAIIAESRPGGLSVTVRDDGVGFRPAAVRESAPGHLGLSSMRERVEAAGGSLSIDSAPGRGTVVECFVPMTDSGIARQQLARRDHRDGSAIIGASRARRA